ncbi:hypothetical protein DFH08DRAFT_457198 [Mycena albidolilacea]|uniref:Uncharacterized protein n=1 Tax=Mycena albidolilacea TaxID=1033008 RepID=A0AAD6Z6X2_9AGAR|nr:hypothetical protein DFH08DRAFT_457198 [Mycena albidolilacea]
MVTDSPPDDGALLMPCTDLDPHFSFTSCPHSSHGYVCTTTAQPHENQDPRKHPVYPSPPPTASQPKRNVPLPAAARYQHHFGGILDSPVVLTKAPSHTPLSPPPTIPTPTHALPLSDAHDAHFASLLLPISEQRESQSPKPQLLSPISPEWTPNNKPQDLFAVDDSGDCVLMSQPSAGAYDQYSFASDVDDDILGGAASFGRPALHALDIPMYHNKDEMELTHHDDDDPAGQPGVLLGFPGTHLIEGGDDPDDATSPFEYMATSPSSSRSSHSSRDFDSPSSESDLDDLDFDLDMGPGPSSYSPSPLRSFASLPSPDLDDLDLDMDLGPGLGMSPSRRSVASLPLFDDDDAYLADFPASPSSYSYDTDSSSDSGADPFEPDPDRSISPPRSASPPLALDPASPHVNALCLDLPADLAPPKAPPPPSILDPYTPVELAALLPPCLPPAELDALLAVRSRARVALAAYTAAPASGGSGDEGEPSLALLDHELRRTVPRDAGEPRRRRKRAKEIGREVDALVGLALGLLPPSPSSESTATTSVALDTGSSRTADIKDKDKGALTLRREKAGLAGLASVPQLVARMILRRRERCVRGLDGGGGRARLKSPSPLRCFSLEGDEPPPMASPILCPMELDG